MRNYGFVKVAAAVPVVQVADCEFNVGEIEKLITQAEADGVEAVVFPELCITGYTCQDLFAQQLLLSAAEESVSRLLQFTARLDVAVIVGAPVQVGNLLLNCAVAMYHGSILAIVPKTYLPNYNEFYEKRWFASAQDLKPATICYAGCQVCVSPQIQLITLASGARIGIEICEDVWAPTPPSNHLALAGADIIFNLSASDELIGKHAYLRSLLQQQSARTLSAYVYSSCGYGESTQDVVYAGSSFVYENGQLLAEGERFSMQSHLIEAQVDVEKLRTERFRNTTFVNAQRRMMNEEVNHISCSPSLSTHAFSLQRTVNPHPFIPSNNDMQANCSEIFSIQVMGLAKRIVHTHSKHVIVGISGGLDSTLALLVCVKTFDKLGMPRTGIVGVTMPGFGTTGRTYHNAITLMKQLGITSREISIAPSVTQHFKDIGHDINVHDVTYENGQARERTQILMDLSNQLGGLVIGTGDLSELALGWATYNGDHMSMYGVNAGIPKTLIKYLVAFVAHTEMDEVARDTLLDIIDTPISPELIPADEQGNIKQKTEDLVGPYELHDFYLYYAMRFGFTPSKIFMLARHAFADKYDAATIRKWLINFYRRFFAQQFKRSCLPDGPKVGSVTLSPRGDWRMPTDAVSKAWVAEAESMEG